jgi:hypothetical protein
MRSGPVLSLIFVFATLSAHPAAAALLSARPTRVFLLAGERVRFDPQMRPQFTENQMLNSTAATREGLVRFAATEHGKMWIARFSASEYEVTVSEDTDEDGIGRAPQPGIATLVSAGDHSKLKMYELILNPTWFRIPDGMEPLPNQPVTPADMMAIAWAGEMLHIYFYSQGISLPHHPRPDFQREWRAIAAELGMPNLTHDDGDEWWRSHSGSE